MKAVLQRVRAASVLVDDKMVSAIGQGLLIFLGIQKTDTEDDVISIARKSSELRIFEDTTGRMNLSVLDVRGEVLVVPQFTLCASTRKGRRPGFDDAMPQDQAKILYDKFIQCLRKLVPIVREGVFAAKMLVNIQNDGPATFIIESRPGET